MKKPLTIDQYIDRHFNNEIYSAVEEYIVSNQDYLNLRTKLISDIQQASLQTTEVFKGWYEKREDENIGFNLLVNSAVEVMDYYDTDDKNLNFLVSGTINTAAANLDFHIDNVSEYIQKPVIEQYYDEYLVPVVSKFDLEPIASKFLKQFYPEALEIPQAIDVFKLADRMNLKIDEHKLSPDESVFGGIVFDDCVVDTYDGGIHDKVSVAAGTILVDPDLSWMRSIGTWNNTIIHECVHWYLHQDMYRFRKLAGIDFHRIACQVVDGINTYGDDRSLSFAEWQANAISSIIQAPASMFKRVLETELDSTPADMIVYKMEEAIENAASFFDISKESAKLRAMDAGYKMAVGSFDWVDGHYLRPFAFSNASWQDGYTYTISLDDYAYIINAMPNVAELLAVGKLAFVENHVVVNSADYVEPNGFGSWELTDRARLEADKCMVRFKSEVTNKNVHQYRECLLCKTPVDAKKQVNVPDPNDEQNEQVLGLAEKIRQGIDREERLAPYIVPGDNHRTINNIIKFMGTTQTSMAQAIGITEKTLSYYGRNLNPNVKTGLSICVYMGMTLNQVTEFMKNTGIDIWSMRKEFTAIRVIVDNCSMVDDPEARLYAFNKAWDLYVEPHKGL